MKKYNVDPEDWAKMSDIDKIFTVVWDAVQRPHLISRNYLVSMLADVGNAYRDEIKLRKQLATYCLVLIGMAFLMFFLGIYVGQKL